MWELFGLLAVLVFMVGMVTSLWLVIKFFLNLFAGQPKPIPNPPPGAYASRVTQAAPPTFSADPALLTRAQVLAIVLREISRAANLSKIDRQAYMEVRNYIDRERELLRQPAPIPLPPAQGSSTGSEGRQEGGEKELAPHSTQVSPAPAAVPFVVPFPLAESVATPVVSQPRDPEKIRAAIAKLHADAQAPEPHLEIQKPAALNVEVKNEPEVSSAPGSAMAPEIRSETVLKASPIAPKRPWTERLFTPENIRILQSLGICIIFISAAAFVRTRMWNDASSLTRIIILLLGTVTCSATGYALRRWLSLRITGLGFMVLGQLSLILDTYSTLIGAGSNTTIYPYSPSSLWTLSFISFTIAAVWKAKLLKEPLFDAFTYFGGLAAWGSAMLWLGVDPYLLPATFVLALALPAALSPWMKAHSTPPVEGTPAGDVPIHLPRWSLPWWVNAGFQTGTALLTVVLPVSALLQGREALVAHFVHHVSWMIFLAISIYAYTIGDSKRLKIHPAVLHGGSVLLLIPVPLAAYAFQWQGQNWSIALAAPGAGMAVVALLASRFTAKERLAKTLQQMANWGIGATLAGLAWALIARVHGDLTTATIGSTGCALIVALAISLLRDEDWGAWLAMACAGFETLLCAEFLKIPGEYLPALWFAVAGLASGLWCLGKKVQGGAASDLLAAVATGLLIIHTPFFPTGGLLTPALTVCIGWAALTGFLLLTSAWRREGLRLNLGIASLSMTAVYWVYHSGAGFGAPAPWLAAVVLAAIVVREWVWRTEGAPALGLAIIFAHAVILSAYQAFNAHHAAAGLAFAILAFSPLVLSLTARRSESENWPQVCEFAALLLLGVAGMEFTSLYHVGEIMRPVVLSIIAASLLALSKILGMVAPKIENSSSRAFQYSGELASLLFSGIAVGQIFLELVSPGTPDAATLLTTSWMVGVLPLFIALRSQRPDSNAGIISSIMAAGMACVASVLALQSQFWTGGCAGSLRTACACYFAVALAVSTAALLLQRRWFAPLTATLAILALIGCAFGHWHLPAQAFGLCCALLGIGLSFIAPFFCSAQTEKSAATTLEAMFKLSTGLVLVGASLHLLNGVLVWPVGAAQSYPVAAWLLMCALASYSGMRASFGKSLAAGATLSMAVVHAMRWSGLDWTQFGPGLCATAIVILILRDVARLVAEDPNAPAPTPILGADGLICASAATVLFGFIFGLLGSYVGHPWLWCATLAECALLTAGLTMTARREWTTVPPGTMITRELLAWILLTSSIVVAANAANIPLSGPIWVLLGAGFLLLGMAGEAVVSAFSGKARPEPFLESRHLAALALGAYGLFDALLVPHLGFGQGDLLWRTLFALAAFAIYESFARSTSREAWLQPIRNIAAGSAYLVLLPAGHLAFLHAHSQGSSWGALYFMLLSPVLMAAAHVLSHEKNEEQAALARWGSAGVNAGALILAFAANRGHLAAVPAVALAAIAVQLLLARMASRRRWYSAGICVALAGGVHFGCQALGGVSLGLTNAWPLEMPILAMLGVAMAIAGGLLKLEEIDFYYGRREPFSLVTLCGTGLTAAATVFALIEWLVFGRSSNFFRFENPANLDALIVCLVLTAAAALCAKRWLNSLESICQISHYVAPLATLTGYLVLVSQHPPEQWEWFTLPTAAFLFMWARQIVSSREELATHAPAAESEVSLLLFVASSFAVVPSFWQSLDHLKGTGHYFALLFIALAVIFGAMMTRRKIPLMVGTAVLIIGTIIKAAQWAHHREGLLPLLGILIGFVLVAVSTLFESRMNRAFRNVVDRARAEARMFWVSWR